MLESQKTCHNLTRTVRARQGRKLASSLAATSDRLRGRAEEQVRKVLSPSGKAGADVKGAAAAHKQA